MRSGRAALAGLLVGFALACGSQGRGPTTRPDAPDAAGLYRGAAFEGEKNKARFRVWVHAARPDRLHLEVLPPVGGPVFLLDAGDGKLAGSWLEDRISIVGPSDAPTMERLIGLGIDARGWVTAILDGTVVEGVAIEREGATGALPRGLTLRRGPLELRLERLDVRRISGTVGTGLPPAGFETHPVETMEGASLLDSLLHASLPEGR